MSKVAGGVLGIDNIFGSETEVPAAGSEVGERTGFGDFGVDEDSVNPAECRAVPEDDVGKAGVPCCEEPILAEGRDGDSSFRSGGWGLPWRAIPEVANEGDFTISFH